MTRSHDLTPPVPGVAMIRLDVTDDAAVQQGVQSVLKQAASSTASSTMRATC